MVGNDRPRQELKGRSRTRIRASRLVRRVRLRQTLRAVQQRERTQARGLPRKPVAAPRLWQRFLIVPLMIVVQGIRSGLVWARAAVLPAPLRILDIDPAQFLIIGHRGACASAVENTIESCERAVEIEGVDAVEIDLCVTKDKQVVVWHDWDPDALVAVVRQAGAELDVLCRPVGPPEGHPMRRPVCDLTLDELRAHYGYAVVGQDQTVPARLPVLEDVVRWARTKPSLQAVVLDCKVPPARKELITVVVAALRREVEREPVGVRFVFLTPYVEVLEAMAAVVPAAVRSFDVEIPAGFLPDRSQLSAVARARASGNGWASIGRPLFTIGGWWTYRKTIQADLEMIREARRTPPPMPPEYYVCWTINQTREMRHLLRLGVSGILTDFPTLLCRLLNRQIRQEARRAARHARTQVRRARREAKRQAREAQQEGTHASTQYRNTLLKWLKPIGH
jgi:glycerophosphoryl diester phosphodiesterase